MGVGSAYWAYVTFINPTVVFDTEVGMQTALYDGIQRQDMGVLAMMLLQVSVYAVLGGAAFEFVHRRILASSEREEKHEN